MAISNETDPNKRIVVTGMGSVSPLGCDVKTSIDNLFLGHDGISKMPPEIFEGYPQIDGYVGAFVPDSFSLDSNEFLKFSPVKLNRIHKSGRFALMASAEALLQASIIAISTVESTELPIAAAGIIDPHRVAVSFGTGVAGAEWVGIAQDKLRKENDNGSRSRLGPNEVLNVLPERVATNVSMRFGAKGPVKNVNGACATGNMNIIEAARLLKLGEADVVIAGGAEAQITPVGIALFDGIKALDKNPDPRLASRPFHKAEAGFVMGEGASALVLETLAHAIGRSATIYAELVGYAETADAYHDTAPSGEGARLALSNAMGSIQSDQIYVNAHGTGTGGDKVELSAISEAIGRDKIVGVSSTKGATGHMLGAAGAFEAIATIEALERQTAPPTLKLDERTEVAEGWLLSPNEATPIPGVDIGVNDSFGFGGINAVTVWAKPAL